MGLLCYDCENETKRSDGVEFAESTRRYTTIYRIMWPLSYCRMISISLRRTVACCSLTSVRSVNLSSNFKLVAVKQHSRNYFSGEARSTILNFSLPRYQTNRFSNPIFNACSTHVQRISQRFVRNGHPERFRKVNSRTHSSRANGSSSSFKKNGNAPDAIEQEDISKMPLFKRFRHMWKKYWYILVPVHCVTSVMWLGGFYYASISGVDIAGWLEWVSFIPDSWIEKIRNSPKSGHVAIAYLMYKIFTPARYTVTLTGTHYAIKFLSKGGYIKPMPSPAQMQVLMNERRSKYSRNLAKFRKSPGHEFKEKIGHELKEKIGNETRKK